MNHTYTQVEKTNGILYILNISGWGAPHGEVYNEAHVTMPKEFSQTESEANMANCPHITMLAKKGWTYHRYESTGKKYREKNRLVKRGSSSHGSDTYPATSHENNIGKLIAADLASMARP
jgi:hypothetical protein